MNSWFFLEAMNCLPSKLHDGFAHCDVLVLLIIGSNFRSSAWLLRLFNPSMQCFESCSTLNVSDNFKMSETLLGFILKFPVYRKLIKTSWAAGSTFHNLIFGVTRLGENSFASKISLKRELCEAPLCGLASSSQCHRFSFVWKPGERRNQFPQYGICFWFH